MLSAVIVSVAESLVTPISGDTSPLLITEDKDFIDSNDAITPTRNVIGVKVRPIIGILVVLAEDRPMCRCHVGGVRNRLPGRACCSC